MSRILFADLPVNRVSLKTMVPTLIKLAKKPKDHPLFVTYLNAHCANLAFKNSKYRQILKKADLVYADGLGMVLAARLFGGRLPGRLTTKDFFDEFCQEAQKEGLTLYFLGGKRKVVEKMVKVLKERYPNLKILGCHHGFFRKSEEGELIRKINTQKPDFLLVGMGSPKQEIWLAENLSRLKIKVGWCVGGLFDFISGEKLRCPKWLGDLGFEWLFRLLTEPRRLWKRYLVELPAFGYTLLRLRFNGKNTSKVS